MNRTQHHSNNDVLGAPPGMSIDECNAFPITRIQYADGTPAVASYWRPTNAEIALIVTGQPVRLVVLGTTHPPLMTVTANCDAQLQSSGAAVGRRLERAVWCS